MSLGLVSPILNRGVRSRWVATLPASSKMLTIDAAGDVSYTDIPTAAWGSITGTLSNQTDLQNALNAKLSLTGGTVTGQLTNALGTITASTPLTLTQTWNNAAVTFTGALVNVTDTASNASSLLMDLQVGGDTRAKIEKAGDVYAKRAFTFTGQVSFLRPVFNGDFLMANSATGTGTFFFNHNDGRISLRATHAYSWSSTGDPTAATDLFLLRDAAQTLAQRNSTNAQTFRVYNTFTDASNYERGQLAWESNEFRIGATAAGTGTQRSSVLGVWTSAGVWHPSVVVGNRSIGDPNLWVTGSGGMIRMNRTGLVDMTLGEVNGDSFAIRNNGDSSVMFAVNATTKAATTYGQLTNALGTITASTPLTLTQTWNNAAVTFTGALVNVTDTASNGSSLLMDLQVGGSSKFNVSKSGVITALRFKALSQVEPYTVIDFYNNQYLARVVSGAGLTFEADVSTIRGIAGATTGVLSINGHGWLTTDAAQTLAQRNSTNAQTFRVYNTYTDASNYERGKIEWSSNVLRIGTEKAGTGSARALELQTDGTTRLTIGATGQVLLPTGSQSEPSLSFIDDTDTGIYRQANAINFAVNGLLKQQFQSDGSIAFFGTDPWLYTQNYSIRTSGSGIINFRLGNGTGNATITAGAATFSGQLTNALGTITASTPLTLTQTWNDAAVTFTGALVNVTDTASNASSLLMDLQVGGSSKASVRKDGRLTVDKQINSSQSVLEILAGGAFGISIGSVVWCHKNTLEIGGSADVDLNREAADTLSLRRSTNAQTFRVYNTYTDASNYERGKIEWSSNVLRIGTEKAGTGSARALELQTDGTTRLTIASGGGDVALSATQTPVVRLSATHASSRNWALLTNLESFGDIHLKASTTAGGDATSGNSRFSIDPNGYSTFLGDSTSVLKLNSLSANSAARNWSLEANSVNFGDFVIKQSNSRAGDPFSGTVRFSISASGVATFSGDVTVSAVNIVTDTTTGTKIGTATTQKIGFYDKTPVVQPAAVADATDAASVITQLNLLLSRMRDLGLIAT